jgi:hypothetical protein
LHQSGSVSITRIASDISRSNGFVSDPAVNLHIARRRRLKLNKAMIYKGIAGILHTIEKIQFAPEQSQNKSGGQSWTIPLDA